MPSSQGVVNVSHEEAMNREIPLSPVLREIASIPPIVIEAPISELGELSPEVHVGVKHRVEDHEPDVGRGHTHVEGLP